MPVRLFLSYARDDDEPFVARLYSELQAAGFDVWFDRVSMPSRQLSFYQEIRDAVASCDRLILVIGPHAVNSEYVTQEWRFAYFEALKCVNPIVRLDGADAAAKKIGAYSLIPEDLRLIHAEDFRVDAQFEAHVRNLIRQLRDPLPPVGKLVAVPSLPPHYLDQPVRLAALRDILLADLRKPIVVSGAAAQVGLHGMPGIGKSVLAAALAQRPEVRRAFPDGVYWVKLGQAPNVADVQRGLARALGDDGLFTRIDVGTEKLRELLTNQAALLVLDDVWRRADADAFHVIGPRGRLLLTTRDAGLVAALAVKENHYQVQLPAAMEAHAILAKAAGVPVTELPAEAHDVAMECGYLPLGLALCGGMVYGGCTWRQVLEALREHDLEYVSDSHPAEEQHRSIWKALDASIRALPEGDRERFAELAVFELDRGAPEAVIETLWRHTARLRPIQARDLLRRFKERSLVDLDPATRRITLHDLLHNFATGMAIRSFGTMAPLHLRLIDAYRQAAPRGWASGPNDGYFFEGLLIHLAAAGLLQEALGLLRSVHWLAAKLRASTIYEVLADYTRLMPHAGKEAYSDLEAVFTALNKSGHVLAVDRAQLAGQLLARLSPRHSQTIARLLDDASTLYTGTWLHPLAPSLAEERLVRILLNDSNGEIHFCLTRDGKRVVSAGCNGMRISDFDTGRDLRVWRDSPDPANWFAAGARLAVAIDPGGRCAASGTFDRRLMLWDLETGDETLISRLDSPATALAFCQDSRRLVSGHLDGSIVVWDVETKSAIRQMAGPPRSIRSLRVDPDGSTVISASDAVRLWDVESGAALKVCQGHLMQVEGIALAPAGDRFITAGYDATLRIWSVPEGEQLAILSEVNPTALEGRNFTLADDAFYNEVVFDPSSRFVFSGSSNGTIKRWDVESGRVTESFRAHAGNITGLAATPDGQHLLSAGTDGTLKIWRTGAAADAEVEIAASPWSISPDHAQILSWSTRENLGLRNLRTGALIWSVAVAGLSAMDVKFNWTLASIGSSSGRLELWDLQRHQLVGAVQDGPNQIDWLAMTADGRLTACLGNGLNVWDVSGAQRIFSTVIRGYTIALGLTPDGSKILRYSYDRSADETQMNVWDLESGLEISADLAGSKLNGSGDTVWQFERNGGFAGTCRKQGERLVVTPNLFNRDSCEVRDRETGLCLWKTAGLSLDACWSLSEHARRVIIAEKDWKARTTVYRIKIWDLDRNKAVFAMEKAGRLRGVAVSDGGNFLITVDDFVVEIRDIANGRPMARFTGDSPFRRRVEVYGSTVVVSDDRGRIHLLRIENL